MCKPTYNRAGRCVMDEQVRAILTAIGEDPEREGLRETPKRVRKSWEFLTEGYRLDPREVVSKALFHEDYDEMVVVRDVEFYSVCEHHMLPFVGRAHVAYLPDGKVVGLSKIPRLIDVFARRLQVQERLTTEVATSLMEILEPRGVGVVLEAQHFCMMMRGVQKQTSWTTTSCMLGRFKRDPKTRGEFLDLIKKPIR